MKKIWNFEPVKTDENVSLYKYGPIKLVWLDGDSVTRLNAYTQLHREKLISDEPIKFFGDRILRAVHIKEAAAIGDKILNLWNKIGLSKAPEPLLDDLEVLYKAYGRQLVQRGITLPDVAGQFNGLQKNSFGRLLIPELGCTSIVKKDRSNFYYGRNLDFDGTALLDMYPSIVIHRPKVSGELCYASFTSDSMPLANISGVNEAGITLSLHKNYSNIVSLGTPVLCIGELVLRNARSLEEAVSLLKKHRPGPAWTYILTDLYNHKAMAVETSAKFFNVREMKNDHLIQANHFMMEPSKEYEFSPPSTYENSLIRYDKIESEIEKVRSIEAIIELLGYQSNEKGELSSFYDIVKPSTLLTYGFENKNGKVTGYFSGEEAPTATGCLAQFDLEKLWKGPDVVSMRQKYPKVEPDKRQMQIKTGKAFFEYFDNDDYRSTLKLIGKQHSPTALCLKAVCLYNLREFDMCLQLVDKNIEECPWPIQQDMYVVKIMAHIKNKEMQMALTTAKECLQKPLSKPKLQSMCKSLVSKKKVHFADQRLRFDFSSGQLLSKPCSPSDIEVWTAGTREEEKKKIA